MGDEQQADIQLVLQPGEQVENPFLNRDIERGGRLVRDQQCRPGEDRQADQHALQHAAGQLVRVGIIDALGVVEPDLRERLQDELLADCLVRLVEERGCLLCLNADRSHRVERIARVLRDESDGPSPQRPEATLGKPQHLLAVERDPAGGVPTAGEEPQHRAGDRRLARAGLSNEGEALAAAKFEPNVANDFVRPVRDRQAVDPEQGGRPLQRWRSRLGAGESGGQSVLRSHRLILLIERAVPIVTNAGAYTSQGHLR